MNLKEALNQYQSEILYLILKDGTNIEIIPEEKEEGYIDNQLYKFTEDNDEFVEEKVAENTNDLALKQMIPKQPGPLRGRGQKKFGKSLRKTVLKSLNRNEKEKNFEKNGKLRNVNDNLILKITENNDFIQCANCFKFFPPDEDDENKTDISIPQNAQNNQKVPSNYPKQIQPNHPQQQKQIIPQQQQKYPQQNPQMLMPLKPNQPPQVKPNQKIPNSAHNKQQQYKQIIPPPQQPKVVQRKNVPGANIRPNQLPMNAMSRGGQNQIFRARKETKNRYDSNNDRNFNSNSNNYYSNNNNYANEENIYYPASGKKQSYTKVYAGYYEFPLPKKLEKNSSYGNLNTARNLNFGFNKVSKEIGYNNNDGYLNNADYYDDSYQYQKNIIIPIERKVNNLKGVNTRNVSNQYQYQYEDNNYDYYYY